MTSFDVLIVGGGFAAQLVALRLSALRVALVHLAPLGQATSSILAQGGIAAAVGARDSAALHLEDTLSAGAGLCDPHVAQLITSGGADAIEALLGYGVAFERDGDQLKLRHEAAHGVPRVVSTSDAQIGAALARALVPLLTRSTVELMPSHHVRALLTRGERVVGALVERPEGELVEVLAAHVILATGGVGGLWAHSSNPMTSRGEGIALAHSVGAQLKHLEMVQFHPTGLDLGDAEQRAPLLTEALRGAGAWIVDDHGDRFVFKAHDAGELAPRDVVARAVARSLASGQGAWLDMSPVKDLERSFPFIDVLLKQRGDGQGRLPIRPCAHFHMGGVAVDLDGQSSVEGLWALGEVACTGLHGANRLASNSLLEIAVLAPRLARAISSQLDASTAPATSAAPPIKVARRFEAEAQQTLDVIRAQLSAHVGTSRDAQGLREALERLEALPQRSAARLSAALITEAALKRRDSAGAHLRVDAAELSR